MTPRKSSVWIVVAVTLLLLVTYVGAYASLLDRIAGPAFLINCSTKMWSYEARYSATLVPNQWFSRLFQPLNTIDRKIRPQHWWGQSAVGGREPLPPVSSNWTAGGEMCTEF